MCSEVTVSDTTELLPSRQGHISILKGILYWVAQISGGIVGTLLGVSVGEMHTVMHSVSGLYAHGAADG